MIVLKRQGVGSASPYVIGFTSLDFWLHCANAAALAADLCQLLLTAWHCHMRPKHQQSPVCVLFLLPEPFPAPHTMRRCGPELPKNCQQPRHSYKNSLNTPVLRYIFAGQRTHCKYHSLDHFVHCSKSRTLPPKHGEISACGAPSS